MDLARQNRLKNSIPPKTKPAGNIGGFVNGLTRRPTACGFFVASA
jgi:hypothetical protein